MEKNMICICCPVGCRLEVKLAKDGEITVNGNRCPRGEVYGIEEITAPKRVVTAVVRTDSEKVRYAPVRTSAPLPKEKIGGLLRSLYRLEVKAPITAGNIVITNFENTGVDIIFTRTIEQ